MKLAKRDYLDKSTQNWSTSRWQRSPCSRRSFQTTRSFHAELRAGVRTCPRSDFCNEKRLARQNLSREITATFVAKFGDNANNVQFMANSLQTYKQVRVQELTQKQIISPAWKFLNWIVGSSSIKKPITMEKYRNFLKKTEYVLFNLEDEADSATKDDNVRRVWQGLC